MATYTKRPVVFVSCGQVTENEKQLGKAACMLLEQSGFEHFYAQNQSDFRGLTDNILRALNRAQGFVFVMHPRGLVTDNKGTSWHRGSVWIEQEIAIAAFLQQILGRDIKVGAYIHENISRREGIRDLLHLNPTIFKDDSEVLADLSTRLRGWQIHKEFEVLITSRGSYGVQGAQVFTLGLGIRTSKRSSKWAVQLNMPQAALSHNSTAIISKFKIKDSRGNEPFV